MEREAEMIWVGLEFRRPALLRLIEPLTDQQMLWIPEHGANSIAWLVWHIAEVEDNWIRSLVCGEPRHFPFGCSVRTAMPELYPVKLDLLDYFLTVRALTKSRLEKTAASEFEMFVKDNTFGFITIRELWAGVVTSFAWHAGQIALMQRLMAAVI
jgi:uncharacterized damage-inducible protein DinB